MTADGPVQLIYLHLIENVLKMSHFGKKLILQQETVLKVILQNHHLKLLFPHFSDFLIGKKKDALYR